MNKTTNKPDHANVVAADLQPQLILASGSRYRMELVARLGLAVEQHTPGINETAGPDESPIDLARRLAVAKAEAVAQLFPEAIVIGSDQVAALGDRILSKPGNKAKAAQQLADCSGKEVVFHTAVCVVGAASKFRETHTDFTRVGFRQLTDGEISRYLDLDEPWDCAGSFRVESRGALLFESYEARDPTGLIGLPLIWLSQSLRRAGLKLL